MPCLRFGSGFICLQDVINDVPGVDLRTKVGQEALIIATVIAFRGLSYFWGTETMQRCHAHDRLCDAGVLIHEAGGTFPWNPAYIDMEKAREWLARKLHRKTLERVLTAKAGKE